MGEGEAAPVGRVKRFEDLVAWRKARLMVREIYSITKGDRFRRDPDLVRQIRRAAVSVMANIAEGFERGGRGEFHQFLVIAKGSCAEVRSHLYVALDGELLTRDEFQRLSELAAEVGRILGGLRAAVERQRNAARELRAPYGDDSELLVLSPQHFDLTENVPV